jgi:hypothetical protein
MDGSSHGSRLCAGRRRPSARRFNESAAAGGQVSNETARIALQEEVVYFVGLVSAALVASGLIQLYFTSGERVGAAGLQSENRPRQPRADRG